MIVGHDPPLVGITVGEQKPFAIWPVAKDDGDACAVVWSVDVGSQDDAVVHLDPNVPLDSHPIAEFGTGRGALLEGHAETLT
jgi:hypothetical protein